jgi:peptide/nickel transport system permease protein
MTTSDLAAPIPKLTVKPQRSRSLWQDALVHLWHDRLTMLALSVLVVMTVICAFGPPVVENVLKLDPNRTNIPDRFLRPGEEGHLLGTDHLGRDQFIRLLYGGRVSLTIAFGASLMIIAIGVTLGLLAGYYGGTIDDLIGWAINTLAAIPPLFLLLIASALWTPSAEVLVVLLALLGWIGTTRLVRGEVLSLKQRDYILAAQALGSPNWRLLLVHILPNLLPIIIVTMTIIAGNLILAETSLSFLGVGVVPPTPSWGNMLTDSRSYFATGVHLVVWPGIFIMTTVLCFYLVGDGLRDALDPRSARKGRH